MHGSVMCLRKQLAKSRAKPDRLHRLAACILCATAEELRRTANWPGAGPASRQRVIEELQVRLHGPSAHPPGMHSFLWSPTHQRTCRGLHVEALLNVASITHGPCTQCVNSQCCDYLSYTVCGHTHRTSQ